MRALPVEPLSAAWFFGKIGLNKRNLTSFYALVVSLARTLSSDFSDDGE